MKWRDLTPDQLVKLSSDLDDRAHDMEVEREFIEAEQGFDLVAALECVARRLRREAKRREVKERENAMHPDDAKAEREAKTLALMGH